jgi:CheY-like chemotaxis protein
VHVLIATDAPWVLNDVRAALDDTGVTFTVCSNGREVTPAVAVQRPDVAVLDSQIGSMGAMAVTMALRLDESAGLGEHVPVVMLLDRAADVHLARRSGAEAWLIKPLDPIGLRRAVQAALAAEADADGETAVAS